MKRSLIFTALTAILSFMLMGNARAQGVEPRGRHHQNSGWVENKNVSNMVHGKRSVMRKERRSEKKAFKQSKQHRQDMNKG